MTPTTEKNLLQAFKADKTLQDLVLRGWKAALILTDRNGNVLSINDSAHQLPAATSRRVASGLKFADLGIEHDNQPVLFDKLAEKVLHTGIRIDLMHGVKAPLENGQMNGWMTVGGLQEKESTISGFIFLLGESQLVGADDTTLRSKSASPFGGELFVRKDGEYLRVNLSEVQAVEAMENYVQIITERERIVVHTTMKHMQERLKDNGFIRVHRSYLVPKAGIERFDESRVQIGVHSIPVGKSYRAELIKSLNIL